MIGHLRIWSLPLTALALFVPLAMAATARQRYVASDHQMRVVFFGFVDRQPRNGTGRIDGARLTEMEELSFLRAGGELSPDGQSIAFDTCRKTDRSIAIARRDGSDVRRIIPVAGDSCVDLRWSRDGSKLSYGSPIDRQLHVVQLDTGIDTPLPTPLPSYGWHSWSPHGDAIVFETGRGGSRRLDVIDLAAWRTRPLVGKLQFGACEVWAPDWSPVGDRIAFTTCDRKLYVVKTDGSALTLLAEAAYAPRWSVDGSSLLFLSGRMLLHVPANGGTVQRVGVLPYSGGPFSVGPF
jgi:Tol biopolymer transport system component